MYFFLNFFFAQFSVLSVVKNNKDFIFNIKLWHVFLHYFI